MFRVLFAALFIISLIAMLVLPPLAWVAIVWAAFSIGMAHLGGLAGGILLGALGAWLGAAPCIWIFMICLIWTKLFAELADA